MLSDHWEKLRVSIGAEVKRLRTERRLTQAALARDLHVSQGRLSELERGNGSFSAEQLLAILGIFNVPVSTFVEPPDTGRSLQNALARLGAKHLREANDILPSERFAKVNEAIRETLVSADSPRQLAALAPVLVRNVDDVSLPKLYLQLADAGLERRLGWVVENTLAAIDADLLVVNDKTWTRLEQRAQTLLGFFLEALPKVDPLVPDVLDKTIRSAASRKAVERSQSEISRRWRVVTALQPSDFTLALQAARDAV